VFGEVVVEEEIGHGVVLALLIAGIKLARYPVTMSDWSFQTPAYLLLLPLAVVVAVWQFRRRRSAIRYSDVTALRGLPTGRAMRSRLGGAILRGLIVLGIVVACANPRRPDLQTRLPIEGVSIVFVLDVSGSMATADFVPVTDAAPVTRLVAAKQAFRLFAVGGDSPDGQTLPGRPNDQLALVTFASIPATVCPLTLNHTVLLKVLDDQKTQDALTAGTNIGDALGEALVRLDAVPPGRKKAIVLLSDGEHNKAGENTLKPIQSALLAEKLRVPIYTIDCGGDPPADDPQSGQQRQEGRAVMERVAETTGGRSFVANNGAELREVFRSIDKLEREEVVSFRYRRYRELGPYFGFAAAGLLLLLVILERTRWRRFP